MLFPLLGIAPSFYSYDLCVDIHINISIYINIYIYIYIYIHIHFKTRSGALRLNTRREGLNNTGFPGRFPCLPPCWSPCTDVPLSRSLLQAPSRWVGKTLIIPFFLLLAERLTSYHISNPLSIVCNN